MTPGHWIAIGTLVLVVYGALISVAWNERALRLASRPRMTHAMTGSSDGHHATKDILESLDRIEVLLLELHSSTPGPAARDPQ